MGNFIVVGKIDHLVSLFTLPSSHLKIQNSEAILVDNQGASVSDEAGVLWIEDSTYDETGVILYVTGKTDDAVLLAGQALSNEFSFPMFTGNFGVVLSTPPAPDDGKEIKQLISFETLGFDDTTAYGTFEQSLKYRVPQPIMWTIQYGAALDLHFAHSELANSDESFVTVLLNDTPVESILLTKDNAKDAHQVINLPARLFAPGGNTLEIVSNMTVDVDRDSANYLSGELDCIHDDDSEYKAAWLVVYANSELGLPGEQQSVLLDLSDFPTAFMGTEDLSELVFILPEVKSVTTIGSAIRIAEYLGQYSEGPVLYPQVRSDQNLGNGPYIHQVVIGRPSENSVISSINSKLPQPFITGTDNPEPVDALVQVAPQDGTVGYIQAVTGSEGESIVIFTGTNDEGVSIATNGILNPEYAGDIAGDLSIVSSDGLISAVDIFEDDVRQSIVPLVVSEEVEPEEYPKQTSWIYWLAGSILLITVVILIVSIYINRKPNQIDIEE